MGRNWARLLGGIASALLAGTCLGVSSFSVQVAQASPPAQSGATDSTQAAELPIVIANVEFANANGIDQEEQQAFAKKLESMSFHSKHWREELTERVKDFWQQHGYFLAGVWVEVQMLNKDADKQLVAIDVNVNEGEQYHLKELLWKGATAFSTEELAALMPMGVGDIFDTSKVRNGLEALRGRYVSQGYVQFTCVPQTKIDRQARTITLIIDLDEGQKSSPQASLHETE